MAALTPTFPPAIGASRPDKGIPQGRAREVVFSVSPGNNQTNEWVDLSKVLRTITSIVGVAQTAGVATPALVQANKLGTAGAAQAGAVAVQIAAASTTLQITVRGFPRGW